MQIFAPVTSAAVQHVNYAILYLFPPLMFLLFRVSLHRTSALLAHCPTTARRLVDDFVQGDPALPTDPPQPCHQFAVPALCGSQRRVPRERCALLVGGAEVQGKRPKVVRCVSALVVHMLCLLSLTLKGRIHDKFWGVCYLLVIRCFILKQSESTDESTLVNP